MSLVHVLLISDDEKVCTILQTALIEEGHRITQVSNTKESLALLRGTNAPDLLLVEAPRHRGSDRGLNDELLTCIHPSRIGVLLEAGDTAHTHYAQGLGVETFFSRPLLRRDIDQWLTALPAFGAQNNLPPHIGLPGADCYVEELDNGRFFLAACPAMKMLYKNLRVLAPVDVSVLLLGESGVGKEIVSMLLHKHSLRAQRAFINVNCAALPSELLESELFGYEVGAFTGAAKAKPGKFELAHRGTIMLDEIGEMSAPMQAKLLHVLQDGQFSRLGARTSSHVDVRVMAATNINMEEAIADRTFREDLYYRLNAFSIYIPPLRERGEEIPHLLREMFRRGAIEFNQPDIEPSQTLIEAAQEYSWPGNLRELRNLAIRTLVLRDETTAIAELQSKLRKTRAEGATGIKVESAGLHQPHALQLEDMRSIVRVVKDQAEIQLIQKALDAAGWNRRRAAANLQISYRTLLYKIQQYGLNPRSTSSSHAPTLPSSIVRKAGVGSASYTVAECSGLTKI